MPEITIDVELCVGCRGCVLCCSEGVFDLVGDYLAILIAPEKCISCMECEQECPVDAIHVA